MVAFAEIGIVGSFTWVAILVTSFVTLFKISNRGYLSDGASLTQEQTIVAEKESLIALAMLYSLVAYVVAGFFLSRTYVPILYLYLGMSAACFGRVRLAFPKITADHFYQIKEIVTYSAAITFGGIFAIYILIKIFL